MVIQIQNEPWANVISGLGTTLGSALQQVGKTRAQERQQTQKQAQENQATIWNRIFQQGKQLGIDPESLQSIASNAFAIQKQYGLDPNSAVLAAFAQSEGSDQFPLQGAQGQGPMAQAMQRGGSPGPSQAQGTGKPPSLMEILKQQIPGYHFLKSPAAEPARRGVEAGIAGRGAAALKGEGEKAFQERTGMGEDEGFINRLLYSGGQLAADLPFYSAGAGIGTALGGPLGGGIAGFALPGILRQSLSEYQQYLDNGGEGSFERFLNSAGNVAQAGREEAAKGAIFGSLGPLGPVLKKIPGMGKVLNMKTGGPALEKAMIGTLQAAGLLGSEAAAKQKLPSKNEVIDTFVQTIGLNLAHLPNKTQERVVEKIQKSGMAPEEFSAKFSEEVSGGGKEFETIREKIESPQDVKFTAKEQKTINNLVNRISVQQPTMEAVTTERVAQEARPGEPFEVQKIKEEQIERAKKSPVILDEILEETKRVEEAREKERPKRDETIRKRETAKEDAIEQLSFVNEEVRDIRGALGNAADELELARRQGQSKERIAELQRNYDRLSVNYDEAIQKRDSLKGTAKTGVAYETPKELRTRAVNRAEEIMKDGEKAMEGSRVEKKLKEAWEKIKDRKPLPGEERIMMDQFRKAKDAYLQEYRKMLNSVNNYLKNPGLSESQASQLKERKAIFENAIKELESYEKVGRRRQALRMTKEALEKRLPKRVTTDSKAQKIDAKKFFEEFKPSEEKIERDADQLAPEAQEFIENVKERRTEREAEGESAEEKSKEQERKKPSSFGSASSPSYALGKFLNNRIAKITGKELPPFVTTAMGQMILGGLGIGTYQAIKTKAADAFRMLKAVGMDDKDSMRYTNDLIRSGIPKKRVEKIRRQRKAVKNALK